MLAADAAGEEGGESAEMLALERQSRSDGREIRLISGLTTAEWRVYQRERFIRKLNAHGNTIILTTH